MRRRETNVWPAFADLMTALSVVGMGLAFVMMAKSRQNEVAQQTLSYCETFLKGAELIPADSADAAEAAKAFAAKYAEREDELRRCVEATAMKDAVELAENAMREVAAALGQEPSDDLSVPFGEDVVTFATNETRPSLTVEGRDKLKTLCETLKAALSRRSPTLGVPLSKLSMVFVEGHTDRHDCPRDPGCNWKVSADRASRFRVLMERPDLCPGGKDWNLVPLGLADSNKRESDPLSRRIEIRVVPDYAEIVKAGRGQ
jgi:flagellar motor protein MotB